MEEFFKSVPAFKNVYVKGEVSGTYISPVGHLYFNLKDKRSKVPCIVYQWCRKNIGFEIENGMNLLVTANVTVYWPHGKYQLDVRSATDDGLGRLFIAYQQLKKKLSEEGLFDEKHKKELVEFPKRIGVVTSRKGSVIHDIIKTVEKQWPYCEVLLFPAAVQGVRSKPELITQITRADNLNLDVLIVARGGGSLEELQSYNEEKVVRTIFRCKTPVISAVGHEDNVTLCDLVADKRASTPTMAASLAVKNKEDVKNHINHLNSRLISFISSELDKNKKEYENILSKPLFRDSTYIYFNEKLLFDNLRNRFENVSCELINHDKNILSKLKQEYVIRHPCKLQLDDKKSNLNNFLNRLIDSMNSIINNHRVNLDSTATDFKFHSNNLLSLKRHQLEIYKSYLKTNPCQGQIAILRKEIKINEDKINREVNLKLKTNQKELDYILNKSVFKNPSLVYLNQSRKFKLLTEKFSNRSREFLLSKNHDFDSIKNNSIIKNPQTISSKKRETLDKLIDRFESKSNEIILTNNYRLNSIKSAPIIKNHMQNTFISNTDEVRDLKFRLNKSYKSQIKKSKKDLDSILTKKLFKNPEMLYVSQKNDLNNIKTMKIIRNPYILLEDYKNELKIYEEKLDKINQVIMLKKEQQKQKRNYTIIIIAIIVAVILIIIFGGIL